MHVALFVDFVFEFRYTYFDRLAGMPKIVCNSAMDEFMQIDDDHYWCVERPIVQLASRVAAARGAPPPRHPPKRGHGRASSAASPGAAVAGGTRSRSRSTA